MAGVKLAWLRRIPTAVAVLLVLDGALVLAPLIDFWAGSPFAIVRNRLDLDSEHSLPAWYSSMQWFCVGVLFGLFAIGAARGSWRKCSPGMVTMALFALLCLAFSAEEIIAIHEWLGQRSDVLLPGQSRANTRFSSTGIWPLLIGMPIVAILAFMVVQMRRIFAPAPRAMRLLIVGLAVMFAGALIVELGANLIAGAPDRSGMALLQLAIEEGFEMVGVSLLVWSALDLLHIHGFELHVPQHALSAAMRRDRMQAPPSSSHERGSARTRAST